MGLAESRYVVISDVLFPGQRMTIGNRSQPRTVDVDASFMPL